MSVRFANRALTLLTVAAVGGVTLVGTGAAAAPAENHTRDRAVQRVLDRMTTTDGLPGAQAVVVDQGRVSTLTSGLGDLEDRTPMPGAGGFLRGASNLKSMVATVVLQLVGEGKVVLDAPVARYLPGVIPAKAGDADKITIRQLLQHTSGLHNYTVDLPAGEDLAPFKQYSRKGLLDIGFAKPADFEPGTEWSYSNIGYVLLGMLIEKVTGNPWQNEIKVRVFTRVGMTDSYFPDPFEFGIRAPHARGYLPLPTPGGGVATVDITDFDTSRADAAGSGNTTPRDLLRFYTALLGGQLLRPDLLAEMKKVVPVPDPNIALGYGLGLGRITLPCGGTAWANGGNFEGFQTLTGVIVDDRGRTVRAANVFTNTTFTEANVAGALDQFEALYAALCDK